MASKGKNWVLNSNVNSIIDRNKESISQKIILGQRKKGMPNTLYDRATEIGKSIEWNIDKLAK